MVKVAINGFGRIGRNTLRAAIREGIYNEIDYVAINDPGLTPANAAHVFKYDSVMGKFDGTVEVVEDGLVINGKKIKFYAEKDPAALPWAELGVDGCGIANDPPVLDFQGMGRLAGYSFMLFNLLCAPCFAAMGAIKREMNSKKWTAFAIAYQCIFAYAVSLMVYQIGSAFAGNIQIVGFIFALLVLAAFGYLVLRPAKKAK